MNVSVKHNGTTISSYVIEYTREHKICTGIGQLEITLSLTYPTDIVPWDTIDIYENGSFQVKYYVSSVSKSQPDGVIRLECQDKSKRLIDYFIPDQYTITYPSYTGYWIKKFLTEAGVSYSFSVPSTGKLLSNYTNLGLAPAYEQILTLLQLSGWYMFFDGNGIAKIGTLTSDFSNVRATYNRDDILEISKITDDKMLRNRAVVWGSFDASRNEYAYADVKTNTRWNYDRRDYRTMVVSNGNIQDKSSAYGIANTLIKEFARATVEKHLIVAGAAGRDLGDVVRVRSNVYNGSGLITTYGVSMSKSGLVTNMVLDERCPRLFGFFDFGDWVYVGTYGDGVWRKHLKYDPTWYNFSTGLESDLAVTDLHINNEVFGAITASGGMHYALSNDGPWQSFVIDSLTSSFEASIQLGPGGEIPSGVEMTIFSGLMGRATIVDKLSNAIKYGVDTYSGINYGDYFMMYSGMFPVASGITSSGISSSGIMASGYRGWIVEYDPFTLVSGVYPISISGNFNIQVIDLENDGLNDYVSIKTSGAILEGSGITWNYGRHASQPFASTSDSSGYAVTSSLLNAVGNNEFGFRTFTQPALAINSVAAWDNQVSNEIEVVSVKKNSSGVNPSFVRNKLTRTIIDDVTTDITRTTTTSSSSSMSSGTSYDGTILGVSKNGVDIYRFYYWARTSTEVNIYYQEWNAYTNTLGTEVVMLSQTLDLVDSVHASAYSVLNTGDTCYALYYYSTGGTGSSPSTPVYIRVYVFTIDMVNSVASSDYVTNFELPIGPNNSTYFVPPSSNPIEGPSGSIGQDTQAFSSLPTIRMGLFQNGVLGPQLMGFAIIHHQYKVDPFAIESTNSTKEYLITGNTQICTFTEIYADTKVHAIAERYWLLGGFAGENFFNLQLTKTRAALVSNAKTTEGTGYLTYNGTSISFGLGTVPDSIKYTKIYPLLNSDNSYITLSAGTFYLCSADTLTLGTPITPPAGYDLEIPISAELHSFTGQHFFLCYRGSDDKEVLVPFSATGGFNTGMGVAVQGFSYTGYRCNQIGCFFISESPTSYGGTNPTCGVSYIDMLEPVDNVGNYLVLQRDGTDFHIIQQSAKPIRVDISNSAPLLTVMDVENTFKAHYIFENEILTVHTSHTFGEGLTIGPGSGVRDYRYTMLEVPSGVELASGVFASGVSLGAEKLLLYAMASGVNFAYTNELASGFVQMYAIPSGLAERIEVSNFCGSGQYVFVTTSGDSPMFYQKDPMAEIFESFSGLPVSRATIIRLDDRF